jgi:hypothetical protein
MRIGWAAVALLLLVAACSSSGSSASSATVHVDYPARYLALVAPVNAAMDQLEQGASAGSLPFGLVNGVLQATENFDTSIRLVHWPKPSTVAHVHALVAADAQVDADLPLANAQNGFMIAAFRKRVAHEQQVAGAAANAVRADLGLPKVRATCKTTPPGLCLAVRR